MSTYYELLGVPQSASELEIRSAYGRDVLHLQNETSDKVAQFRAVLDAAFATLVDPVKRSAYDEALAVAVQSGAAEGSDASDAASATTWNAMTQATGLDVAQANDLVIAVANRPGPWDATDSADMAKASVLYGRIADSVEATTAPSRLEWYRTGMAKNFRDAASITHEFSLLTAASSASAFGALDARWQTFVDEATKLSDRFDAQEGTTTQ